MNLLLLFFPLYNFPSSPNTISNTPSTTPIHFSQLRASEKRILLATIIAVNDELKKLPSLVSVDDDDDDDSSSTGTPAKLIAAGRSFDRERMTVVNSKSPADWVELKDQVDPTPHTPLTHPSNTLLR